MFKLKDLSILNIDDKLEAIVLEAQANFPFLDTITSAYRPEDKGVHGTIPLRGMDLRCHDISLGYNVSDYINSKWKYDYKRPDMQVVIFHNTGSGFHLHFQSHPNTSRAERGK